MLGDGSDRLDIGRVGRLGLGVQRLERLECVMIWVSLQHPHVPGVVDVRCTHGASLGERKQCVQAKERTRVAIREQPGWGKYSAGALMMICSDVA
jgi:hypothetical protein